MRVPAGGEVARFSQEHAMTDFDQLIQDIEAEARAEGPEAVAELRAFEQHFRAQAQRIRTQDSAPGSEQS